MSPELPVALILPAAGRSSRMGTDKLWVEAAGHPVLGHTLAAVATAALFDLVVVATSSHNWAAVRTLALASGIPGATLRLVEGGERRQDSVRAGLEACGDAVMVVVHDAARPLVPPGLFSAVLEAAQAHGAATTAVPVVDSIKRVDGQGRVLGTLDRAELVAVQTPQAFDVALLRWAHAEALRTGVLADDDCALVEVLGRTVVTVAGDARNIKITLPADIAVLETTLRRNGSARS